MQTLWQDLRFAVRMLKKNPGSTIVAVLTLAVAIGANAVVFSVMNGLFLRALKVPQPENLYTLEHGSDKDSSESYPDYLDLPGFRGTMERASRWWVSSKTENTVLTLPKIPGSRCFCPFCNHPPLRRGWLSARAPIPANWPQP